MIYVGKPRGTGRGNYGYRDVVKDPDGWVDAKKYLPMDLDLVLLKVRGRKPFTGWIYQKQWDSGMVPKKVLKDIIRWKRFYC